VPSILPDQLHHPICEYVHPVPYLTSIVSFNMLIISLYKKYIIVPGYRVKKHTMLFCTQRTGWLRVLSLEDFGPEYWVYKNFNGRSRRLSMSEPLPCNHIVRIRVFTLAPKLKYTQGTNRKLPVDFYSCSYHTLWLY
jgi:hypothetical protein